MSKQNQVTEQVRPTLKQKANKDKEPDFLEKQSNQKDQMSYLERIFLTEREKGE